MLITPLVNNAVTRPYTGNRPIHCNSTAVVLQQSMVLPAYYLDQAGKTHTTMVVFRVPPPLC